MAAARMERASAAKYKFSEENIISGELIKKVAQICGNSRDEVRERSYYRNVVFSEKVEFDRLVKCFFFRWIEPTQEVRSQSKDSSLSGVGFDADH
jgi:hypothetical protein